LRKLRRRLIELVAVPPKAGLLNDKVEEFYNGIHS
jgi:hypothetical protein